MSHYLRQARRSDVPQILGLIQGLADYENEPDAVEATEESLLATIAFAPESDSPRPPSSPGTRSAAAPALPETEPVTPQRPARCILVFPADRPAPEQRRPAGLALYYYSYSTWRARPGIYLEDLFVVPEARGRGFGRALLRQLARETVEMGGARLEWSVLKWNQPSIGFYESEAISATMMKEWVGMRVDGDNLVKLAW